MLFLANLEMFSFCEVFCCEFFHNTIYISFLNTKGSRQHPLTYCRMNIFDYIDKIIFNTYCTESITKVDRIFAGMNRRKQYMIFFAYLNLTSLKLLTALTKVLRL